MFNKFCYNRNYPLIISGYTVDSHLGDYYKRSVKRLVSSLVKFDLPHLIYPLEGVKSWVKGCSFKADLIYNTLVKFEHPVLWLDADSEVLKMPSIFSDPKFDMALAHAKGHWLTGTLYFNKKALHVVKGWKDKVSKNEPDEITLLNHYVKLPLKHKIILKMLPDSYNVTVHAGTNVSDVIIAQYIRPDVAVERKVNPVRI